MRITVGTLFGRLAFGFLLLLSIAFGAGVGLLFVYTSDLPEIHALEDYRPDTVTELYADDGQSIGTFALQRRILPVSYTHLDVYKRQASSIIEMPMRSFTDPPGFRKSALT